MFDFNPPGPRKDRNPAWDREEREGKNEELRLRLRWTLVAIVVVYLVATVVAVIILASGGSPALTPGRTCGDGVCDPKTENFFVCPQDCWSMSTRQP